jgi:ABC-type Fe3+-hydroxamate transport system substrate-binding protein
MALQVFDALDRAVLFMAPPKRVVSLVPSDTLNLAAIGAGSALVARTDYCELPEDLIQRVPSVGGTKNPRVAEILDLAPDLVIANKEENSKSDLEALVKENIRVYISFPQTVREGIAHLARLARIFGTVKESHDLIAGGYALFNQEPEPKPLRAFCPIWMKPLMTINGETYISDRERKYPLSADLGLGVAKPAEHHDTRYPRITEQELLDRKPAVVLLPSEPHPFSEAERAHFESLGVVERNHCVFIDGKDLTWYGARAVEGAHRLRAQMQALRARTDAEA